MLRKAFSILADNTSLIFKLLIFFVVVLLIAVSLFFSFVNPLTNEIMEDLDVIKEILQSPLDSDTSFYGFYTYLNEVYQEIVNLFSDNIGLLWKFVLFIYVFGLVLRFLVTTTSMPMVLVLDEIMTKNHKMSLFNAIILTFKKSILYSLISSFIIFTIDFALGVLAVLIIKLLSTFISFILALTIGFYVLIILIGIRMALFSQWMPLMVEEKMSVFKALKNNFRRKNIFKSVFPNMLIILIIQIGLILTTILPTLGMLPVFIFSVCIILYEIVKLIAHLDKEGKRYYLDKDEIRED